MRTRLKSLLKPSLLHDPIRRVPGLDLVVDRKTSPCMRAFPDGMIAPTCPNELTSSLTESVLHCGSTVSHAPRRRVTRLDA
jgi:hypothetical protein